MKRLNKKGFTLIELIAVLLIIGVLGTFIAKRYIGFDIHAKEKIEAVQQTAQSRKDGLYKYAGIEKSEEDAATDVETEEENNSE
jgi:prepilin-type N-terminal cleavage/methylation domain-containing protein